MRRSSPCLARKRSINNDLPLPSSRLAMGRRKPKGETTSSPATSTKSIHPSAGGISLGRGAPVCAAAKSAARRAGTTRRTLGVAIWRIRPRARRTALASCLFSLVAALASAANLCVWAVYYRQIRKSEQRPPLHLRTADLVPQPRTPLCHTAIARGKRRQDERTRARQQARDIGAPARQPRAGRVCRQPCS